jgi:hypothetical protein
MDVIRHKKEQIRKKGSLICARHKNEQGQKKKTHIMNLFDIC